MSNRTKVIKDIIKRNMKKHWFSQTIILFVMLMPLGCGLYYAFIHHDMLYGHPVYFVLLAAGSLTYVIIVKRLSKFINWVVWEVET